MSKAGWIRRIGRQRRVKRGLGLLALLAVVPLARSFQSLLSTVFGQGDGEISAFGINHAIDALPWLATCGAISLLIWWLRDHYVKTGWVLTACACVAVFGALNFAAEIAITSAPSSGIGDDSVHRVPHPYIHFKGASGSGGHNRLGYGGAVPAPAKPDGEYRIFFLGGSTVRFGNPPIPGLVQRIFRDAGFDNVRVFNFGVSGSNSSMDLARLVYEVLPYEPDLVVIYNGGNDINLPLALDPRPGYPYNFMVYENHPLYAKHYPTLTLALYGSPLLRLMARRYFEEKFAGREQLRRETGWSTNAWRERIADTYVRNLEVSAKIAGAFDSKLVAFLQPSLLTKASRSEEERELVVQYAKIADLSVEVLQAHEDFIRTSIDARLPESPGPSNFTFADLSHIYDATETTTFSDLIHTRQQAKTLVAERIFEVLRDVMASEDD